MEKGGSDKIPGGQMERKEQLLGGALCGHQLALALVFSTSISIK